VNPESSEIRFFADLADQIGEPFHHDPKAPYELSSQRPPVAISTVTPCLA
jgi:hypothetical protein